jgi:hypothetical protein
MYRPASTRYLSVLPVTVNTRAFVLLVCQAPKWAELAAGK